MRKITIERHTNIFSFKRHHHIPCNDTVTESCYTRCTRGWLFFIHIFTIQQGKQDEICTIWNRGEHHRRRMDFSAAQILFLDVVSQYLVVFCLGLHLKCSFLENL